MAVKPAYKPIVSRQARGKNRWEAARAAMSAVQLAELIAVEHSRGWDVAFSPGKKGPKRSREEGELMAHFMRTYQVPPLCLGANEIAYAQRKGLLPR